jgi:hypothetical protein
MRKWFKVLLVTAVSVGLGSVFADTELETIDHMRLQGGSAKVQTRIEVFEQGQLVQSSEMDVYVADDRKSLAVYKSDREAGQKVLMLDDKFWLFLPNTKRAMRITAMQKMLGEASAGDVASLNWSEDYEVVSRQTDGDVTQLGLTAARKGLSYERVDLRVDTDSQHPKSADFYLKSGKLAKHATFQLAQDDEGHWYVASVALQDRMQKDQLTVIHYDGVEPMTMEAKWFTPNYLLRAAP